MQTSWGVLAWKGKVTFPHVCFALGHYRPRQLVRLILLTSLVKPEEAGKILAGRTPSTASYNHSQKDYWLGHTQFNRNQNHKYESCISWIPPVHPKHQPRCVNERDLNLRCYGIGVVYWPRYDERRGEVEERLKEVIEPPTAVNWRDCQVWVILSHDYWRQTITSTQNEIMPVLRALKLLGLHVYRTMCKQMCGCIP